MSFYGQLCTIPRNASEINLIAIEDGNGNVMQTAAQQWERLNAFIENNDYLKENRGGYAERNESKTPWNHRLDVKLGYNIKLAGTKQLRFSMDIFNPFNLINKNWGRLVFVSNVVNSNIAIRTKHHGWWTTKTHVGQCSLVLAIGFKIFWGWHLSVNI